MSTNEYMHVKTGFTTITGAAVLFGKTTLHMAPSGLVLIGILAPLMGIVGSLAFPHIQRRLGWSNLRIVIFLALAVSCIPAYGCLGFIPFVKHNLPFGGLTTPGEMFGLAIYFGTYGWGVMSILMDLCWTGFAYGAFQGYARACYAELIPKGEEARWYALFAVTDKVCSYIRFYLPVDQAH